MVVMYTYKDAVRLHRKKVAKNVILILSTLLIVWVVASYINVIMHNGTDQIYASWNIFQILVNILCGE